jgi:hypothetical protein
MRLRLVKVIVQPVFVLDDGEDDMTDVTTNVLAQQAKAAERLAVLVDTDRHAIDTIVTNAAARREGLVSLVDAVELAVDDDERAAYELTPADLDALDGADAKLRNAQAAVNAALDTFVEIVQARETVLHAAR